MRIFIQKSILFLALITVTGWIKVNWKEDNKICLHLAGDSTLSIKEEGARPETGWGEPLSQYFSPDLKIRNHAQNGRSTKTFISEGWWNKLKKELSKGDYVVIQFGHNDYKKNTTRTTDSVNYRKNLLAFIYEIKNLNAYPILLTPIVRYKFDKDGNLLPTLGNYPDIVRNIAKEEKVEFIDMHQKSWDLLEKTGPEKAMKYYMILEADTYINFPDGKIDNTHTTKKGAEAIASLFIDGLKEINCGLIEFILD